MINYSSFFMMKYILKFLLCWGTTEKVMFPSNMFMGSLTQSIITQHFSSWQNPPDINEKLSWQKKKTLIQGEVYSSMTAM